MTERTPEDIAKLIKNWDLRSIYEFHDLIAELHDCRDDREEQINTQAYIDMSALPSAEIPADMDTGVSCLGS